MLSQQYTNTFMLFFQSVYNKPSKMHYNSLTTIPLKVKGYFWCYDVCVSAQQLTGCLHQAKQSEVNLL